MAGILGDPPDFGAPSRRRPQWPTRAVSPGETLRHRSTGTVGVAVRVTDGFVLLRDRAGREHQIPITPGGFSMEGQAITPKPAPPPARAAAPARTNSGSVAVADAAARVARPSRILVEGKHDAELIEHVWGDDLRIEGVVVQPLDGADDLEAVVRSFGPRPGRRLGILLDHLVDGSKESRLAARIDHPDVLITGHPYVDVWEAVRPKVVGLTEWPTIPKGQDWKTGILAEIGFPGSSGEFWTLLRNRCTDWTDLQTPLVTAVEQLIDFVTVDR